MSPENPQPLPDRAQLSRIADRYLQRYWPSARRMAEVLRRRVPTNAEPHEKAAWEIEIHAVVGALVADGRINDAKAAAAWAEQLHRRGLPGPQIRHRLMTKGFAANHITAALAPFARNPDAELVRAAACARRRRLGPYRFEQRAERREKDLAALCRAGFPFGLAKRVIDAESVEVLEEEIGESPL